MVDARGCAARARERRCRCPSGTRCSGRRSSRRSRTAWSSSSSGWAASGAPSACSGRPTASTRPRSATPAATRRTRRTRRSAAAAPATPRPCSSSSTRPSSRSTASCACSGRTTTRRRGMRQGNDVGTQYRSAVYWANDAQRAAAEASRDMFQAELDARRLRRDHDGDRGGRAVLLRGAVPPAVPRQEPERLLRARRHRRLLPGRASRLVAATGSNGRSPRKPRGGSVMGDRTQRLKGKTKRGRRQGEGRGRLLRRAAARPKPRASARRSRARPSRRRQGAQRRSEEDPLAGADT